MKVKADHNEEQPLASKSQKRREALELKSLASDLIKLSPAKLVRVSMDDAVREAIMEARKIRSHVARKRQLQYVAKLLRRTDPNPIVQTLEDFEGEARQLTARQHRVEDWRDLLLESGDHAVSALMKQRNDADIQSIRQLIRNTHKESGRGKPPASALSLIHI